MSPKDWDGRLERARQRGIEIGRRSSPEERRELRRRIRASETNLVAYYLGVADAVVARLRALAAGLEATSTRLATVDRFGTTVVEIRRVVHETALLRRTDLETILVTLPDHDGASASEWVHRVTSRGPNWDKVSEAVEMGVERGAQLERCALGAIASLREYEDDPVARECIDELRTLTAPPIVPGPST